MSRNSTPSRAWANVRSPLGISVCIAIVVNIVLAGGYLWSRGGQTTHIQVEASGATYTGTIDGQTKVRTWLEGPTSGGIGLTLFQNGAIPSLPTPRGIDRVRVTALDGTPLLDEDFSSELDPADGWVVDRGSVTVRDGLLTSPDDIVSLYLYRPEWSDYRVDVTTRNVPAITISVRASTDGTRVEYATRPFRDLDNLFTVYEARVAKTSTPGAIIEPRESQTIRSMVAMVLRPYPMLLAALTVGLVLVALLQFLPVTPLFARLRVPVWLPATLAAAVALGAFTIAVRLDYDYLTAMPHVPDELSYIFQAKVFASGHLTATPPDDIKPFTISNPSPIVVHDGKWSSIYPFGHPLMLAPGEFIGAPWLIPPLVGMGCVLLVFAVGRRMYGARVGLLAALMLGASPFFLMQASTFMSHNTAAFYLLVSLLFLVYADRRPVLFPALAGIFLGLIFNTRQLTGAALVPPFALFMLTYPLPKGRRMTGMKQVAAFAAGALFMLLLYFAYRYATTGDAFIRETVQGGDETFGFAGGHSVRAGIAHDQTQMALLILVLNKWPVWIGLAFVLLPFVLGTRSRWDWFFLLGTVFLMGAYTLFHYHGVMYGPRFWYEAMPFLVLLAARGADLAATFFAAAAARLSRLIRSDGAPNAQWAGIALTYGVVIVLTVTGTRTWLYGSGRDWSVGFMPNRANELRGFNGIDNVLVSRVHAAGLDDALVLMNKCPYWQCYGNVFWLNSPALDGNVVYALDDPATNGELFEMFPGRRVYRATYLPYGNTSELTTLAP
ncbi:MAG TPA: glycosyltransferase family 39 protein, partial [Dehalococcoidia bacterium]